MAIPPFARFFAPLLTMLSDGRSWRMQEIEEAIAQHFALTESDRAERLESGGRRYANRVHWGVVHLAKAQLIERPERGSYRITERGRSFLAQHPTGMTLRDLQTFPEHRAFYSSKPKSRTSSTSPEPSDDRTEILPPDERIDASYQEHRTTLSAELLDQIKAANPVFLERLVVDLLLAMGYGGSRQEAGSVIGRSGDDGIDGIIKQDPLGLDVVYLQAKRYTDRSVGRPEVQSFVGSLVGQQASKGVFITTSRFTNDAREYVTRSLQQKVILIDGEQLAELMIDHNIGVAPRTTYVLKRVDSDYFEEG